MTHSGPAHDLDGLLAILREKYIGPEAFWELYETADTPLRILTANIEILNALLKDPAILLASDYVTADSALLERTLEALYREKFTRLTGREIVERAAARSAVRSVVICGASSEARQGARARFAAEGALPEQLATMDEPAPLSEVAGFTPGPRIAGFFAYGYPKQETKLETFRAQNPEANAILIGVGGAVDYYAGITKRPPDWVVDRGIEWLWRLALQPHLRVMRIARILPLALRLFRLKSQARSLKKADA